MRLVTATPHREWMERTPGRFAERCLPLLIANQAGWLLLSRHALRATWNGVSDLSGLAIEYTAGDTPYPARSHFGSGILTWTLPFLFRTSPGYNLAVRGPANMPKDGVCALEGIVETDWSPATFTMNWKLTRPGTVTFEVDEPICMISPVARGEIEAFEPRLVPVDTSPEVAVAYRAWVRDRARFLEDLDRPGSSAQTEGWQRHYFLGTSLNGERRADHQTRLRLREFR